MPLFRSADSSLKFNIVDVTTEEHVELTKLILEHGGKVTDDEECVVKFTTQKNSQREYPRAQIYNVAYIRQCIKESKIVDLETYRLGRKKSSDRCSIAHFLHGYCKCWKQHRRLVPTNLNVSTQNSEAPLSVSRSISEQTEYHTAEASNISNNSDATDSDVEAIPEIMEQNSVSPSRTHRSMIDSQPVLTHNEMEMYASLLAGGDAAEFVNNIDEKRPCNLEFQTVVKPKLAVLAEQQRLLTEQRASLREATNHQQRSRRTIARSMANGALKLQDPINQETTNISIFTISDSDDSCSTPSPMQISIKKEPVEVIPCSSNNDADKFQKKLNYLRVIPEAHEQFGKQTRTIARTIEIESPSTINENELTNKNSQSRREFLNEDNSSPDDDKPRESSLVPNLVHRSKRYTSLDIHLKSKTQTKENTVKPIVWLNVADVHIPRKSKRISETRPVNLKDDVTEPKRRRPIVDEETSTNINTKSEKSGKSMALQETSNDTINKTKRTGALNKTSTRKNDTRYETVDSSEGVVSNSSDTDNISEDSARYRTKNLRSRTRRSFDEPGPSGIDNARTKGTVNEKALKERPRLDIFIETSDSGSEPDEVQHPSAKMTKAKYHQRWRSQLNTYKEHSQRSLPWRKPFTNPERKQIIRYLIKNDAVGCSKGLLIWRQMIEDGFLTHRTPQSILNQYKQYILPNIESFGLRDETLALFQALKDWRK